MLYEVITSISENKILLITTMREKTCALKKGTHSTLRSNSIVIATSHPQYYIWYQPDAISGVMYCRKPNPIQVMKSISAKW